MSAKQQVQVDDRTLTLSNLDKVLYPAAHVVKADVLDYYSRVSQWLLPHLAGRPVTLKRYPDGVDGEAFYEKQAPRFTPDWVVTAPVPRRAGGADIRYVVINDRATLLWCANLASLELHPFLHRSTALDTPTSMIFDLDPGEGTSVVDCARIAMLLRDRLERLGLQTVPKLSGSKGIQVYAPLNTPVTYARTKPFARGIAEAMARELPEHVVSEMARNLRPGKIFIDWSQNSDFKTTVAVYSLRAKRERPFVSLPITWEELEDIARNHDPDRLCLEPKAALQRLETVGDLFAPVLKLKQKLPASFDAPAASPAKSVPSKKKAAAAAPKKTAGGTAAPRSRTPRKPSPA